MKELVWGGGEGSRRATLTLSPRRGPGGRGPPGSGDANVSKIDKCLFSWTVKSAGKKKAVTSCVQDLSCARHLHKLTVRVVGHLLSATQPGVGHQGSSPNLSDSNPPFTQGLWGWEWGGGLETWLCHVWCVALNKSSVLWASVSPSEKWREY